MKISTLLLVCGVCTWIAPHVASAQREYVSLQVFYDELSPYGTWVEYPNYGYVWIPDVGRDFSPYGTGGHWIYTDDGWMWVSDYRWGWAPFHYGRWAYDDSYGWLWVPSNEWGPAWVTWRRSEGYYGWAPMEPGISMEVYFGGRHRVPDERWMFVRERDLNRQDIARHYVNRSANITIINNSTVINNTYTDQSRHTTYVAGPARDDVQKATGTAVRAVPIRENDKPGQTLSNNQLKIYRPQVQASNQGVHKPVPSRIASLNEVKPVAERKPTSQQRNVDLPVETMERSLYPQNDKPPAGIQGPEERPGAVNPPATDQIDGHHSRPPVLKPHDKTGKAQQLQATTPPATNRNNGHASQPHGTKPTENKGKEQPPQYGAPQRKDGETQSVPPRTSEDAKDKPKSE